MIALIGSFRSLTHGALSTARYIACTAMRGSMPNGFVFNQCYRLDPPGPASTLGDAGRARDARRAPAFCAPDSADVWTRTLAEERCSRRTPAQRSTPAWASSNTRPARPARARRGLASERASRRTGSAVEDPPKSPRPAVAQAKPGTPPNDGRRSRRASESDVRHARSIFIKGSPPLGGFCLATRRQERGQGIRRVPPRRARGPASRR